jgi:hypothetical protein
LLYVYISFDDIKQMLSKPSQDCGCGRGKYNCLTKNSFAAILQAELKRLDCGCGCKGTKNFKKKYGGSVLKPCPPGYQNQGLTCLEECKAGEVDDGLFCRDTNLPGPGWVNDGLTFRDTNLPGPGWVNDGLTMRNTNPPGPEWINDGLTFRKPIVTTVDDCPPGWISDPLTCRAPIVTRLDDCPSGYRTEPLTCMKDLQCNTRWDGCCSRGLFGECYGCARTDCSGPDSRSRNPRTTGGEVISRNPRTSGGEVIGQEIRNQEIRPHPTRGKKIEGRVDFDALLKELDKGLVELFSEDGALARAFDPEKNGVGDAFRKFGDDMKRVLEEVGNRIKDGFNKMGAAARAAFEEFARNAERDFKQFGDDFVAKMKDPDFWVEAVGIMAMIAGAAVSLAITVGTLGIGAPAAAGIMAAAAMAGPAAKMIAAGARGEPIDALDIAQLVIAGATAAIPGMGPTVQAAMKTGTTVASFAISAVQAAQSLGFVPSTCIANCPPPPNYDPEPPIEPRLPPVNPPPAGQLSDEEIMALAPPCTFFRVVGKPTQAPPCNALPRETRNGPPHYTEEEWIEKYRRNNYGDTSAVGPGGELISQEDNELDNIANVPIPDQPQINTDNVGDINLESEEMPELNLDFGEMPQLELDLGETPELNLDFGEMPQLELDLGETPELNLDFGETPELNLDFGEMPQLELNLGEMPQVDSGGMPEASVVPPVDQKPVPMAERQLEPGCYAKRYPDLVNHYKISVDNLTERNKEDLMQHWITYGKNEGRNPSCIEGGMRGGKSLTLYYADWCQFCKKFLPIWKKLRVPGIKFRMVEEKQNNELQVDGYPTIVYRDGSRMEKYTGPRTKSGIEKFLKNKL